jgi:hypothetical protein
MHPKFHGFRTPESKAASYCKLFGFYNGEGGFDGKKIFKKKFNQVSYRRRLLLCIEWFKSLTWTPTMQSSDCLS